MTPAHPRQRRVDHRHSRVNPHALSADEQGKLKTLLTRLRAGRTLILLGSRESEEWLTSDSNGPGVYPLPGLDPQASSVLVDRILARHGATRHLENLAERQTLDDLVKLLGGYPLPLTVVLPVLATSKPSEILKELREGDPGADPTGLIHQAIEYSHGKLDESLQNSLLLLAPFTSVIMTGPALGKYQNLLLQHEVVRELDQLDVAAALSGCTPASPSSVWLGRCTNTSARSNNTTPAAG